MFSATLSASSRHGRQLVRHARRPFPAFSSSARAHNAPFKPKDKYNFNPSSLVDDGSEDHARLPVVTANELESRTKPPRGVRMLVRDFIEDSLYNPNYGYFSKQATIFTSMDSPIDFAAMRDSVEFQEEVAQRYAAYGLDTPDGPGRQIWHTPTELFQPYYGHSIARCLVSEYLLKYFPYEDFVVYEIGAGNGTLAMNILDLLRDEYPEVYERTRYNIIEISGSLAELQRKKLSSAHPCVKVNHKSVLHWNTRETSPCYFVAMEVIDNFAHDMIRYDYRTLEPYQAYVSIDENGDFGTHYTKVMDPLISSFLTLRDRLQHPLPMPALLVSSEKMRKTFTSLPFAPNLSLPEYIPTRLLSLLLVLRRHFPRHRLLLSDFSSLPDTIRPGVNAPVVQTRYQNTTVPCTTLLVAPGFFDIFFPTDFDRLRDMYEHVLAYPDAGLPGARALPNATSATPFSPGTNYFSSHLLDNRRSPADGVASASGLPVGERKSSVFTHKAFLETYADLDTTRMKNGENPMLQFYENVKFLF